MLGLPPAEAKSRFEQVISFAELEQFVDLKLKNYSSGMQVRLAFSVMIQVDADILLIDEVLAVGDAAFQQKCYDEFNRLRDEGRTLLLVTHDMNAVNRFCHRAMLLERGEVVTLDEPHVVSNHYLELNFGREERVPESEAADAARAERRAASIVDTWFEDEHGQRTETLAQGRPCSLKAMIEFHGDVEDPLLAFSLEDEQHRVMFATSTAWKEERTGRFGAGEKALLSVSFDNPFAPARYYATPTIARRGAGKDVIDRRERMASVVMTGSLDSGGQVDLPHDLSLERRPAESTSGAPR
jgi:energy-coupling factor transporter ATP-binding protein EcfA2